MTCPLGDMDYLFGNEDHTGLLLGSFGGSGLGNGAAGRADRESGREGAAGGGEHLHRANYRATGGGSDRRLHEPVFRGRDGEGKPDLADPGEKPWVRADHPAGRVYCDQPACRQPSGQTEDSGDLGQWERL